jgi:hypothetical protein
VQAFKVDGGNTDTQTGCRSHIYIYPPPFNNRIYKLVWRYDYANRRKCFQIETSMERVVTTHVVPKCFGFVFIGFYEN